MNIKELNSYLKSKAKASPVNISFPSRLVDMLNPRCGSKKRFSPAILALVASLILKLSSDEHGMLMLMIHDGVYQSLTSIIKRPEYNSILAHITAALGTISLKAKERLLVRLESQKEISDEGILRGVRGSRLQQHCVSLVDVLRSQTDHQNKLQLVLNVLVSLRVLLKLTSIPMPRNFRVGTPEFEQFYKRFQNRISLWTTLVEKHGFRTVLAGVDRTAETANKNLVRSDKESTQQLNRVERRHAVNVAFTIREKIKWFRQIADLLLPIDKEHKKFKLDEWTKVPGATPYKLRRELERIE
jgi:hypothetical protein